MSIYSIAHGEVMDVLPGFRDCAFDALMCDPPYGFSFMGKQWDYDVPSVDLWSECLRVLKPGAPLVAFGGPRTYHRMACRIEDAGFELRDCLMWLFGKGFPKSQNIGLAIDKAAGATRQVVGTRVLTGNAAAPATDFAQLWNGYGTALKPAYEPIVFARKPLDGTMADNVERWGVGGLAIDACRIGNEPMARSSSRGLPKISENVSMGGGNYERQIVGEAEGRWPANLILDEDAAALLDASVAPTKSVPFPANEASGNVLPFTKRAAGGYADAGGPSRFFYCSKVSTKEREAGCEGLALRSAGEVTEREDGSDGLSSPRAGAGRTGGARNHHPTLKPIALTTWLARLLLPPCRPGHSPPVILVPFAGAGSEMVGALKAGWGGVFGIEREAEYVEIARARLAHWCKESEAA